MYSVVHADTTRVYTGNGQSNGDAAEMGASTDAGERARYNKLSNSMAAAIVLGENVENSRTRVEGEGSKKPKQRGRKKKVTC